MGQCNQTPPDLTPERHKQILERPVEWCEEILRITLDECQRKIIRAAAGIGHDKKRVDIKAANDIGKTFAMSAFCHWFIQNHYPSTVIITSSTDRQMWHQFWKEFEVHYSRAGGRRVLGGDLKTKHLNLGGTRVKWFVQGFVTDQEANFEGWHNANLCLVMDEAKGIPDPIWRGGERLIRAKEGVKRIIASGTPPLSPIGEFCQISLDPKKAEAWHHLNISAWDSPRILKESNEEALRIYGKDNPFYVSMVLGQIPKASDDSAISIEDVEAAANLDLSPGPLRAVGVDVSRKGEDKTVITLNLWPVFVQFKHPGTDKIPWITARIKEAIKDYPNDHEVPLNIDDSGLGGGVTDELEAEGYHAVPCNFGGKANDEEHYYDFGTEMYFTLGKILKERQISIPNDPALKAQLYQRTMVEPKRKGGRWLLKLLSKPEMRKHKLFKGFNSPDEADSLALAACEPPPESRSGLITGIGFAGEIARR